MDDENTRKRSACDRCHGQKLRCPKRPGVETCDRCTKANAKCVFSPFRQKKELAHEIEKDRVTINTQLTELEAKIPNGQDENVINSIMASTKRKRTASASIENRVENDLPSTRPPSEPVESGAEIMGSDWVSNQFQWFPDCGNDPLLADLDFDNIGSPFDFSSMTRDPFNQKDTTLIRTRSPSNYETFNENENSHSNKNLEQQANERVAPSVPRWSKTMNSVHPQSGRHLVRQLSELNVGLYDHRSTIPPQSIHDPVPDGNDWDIGPENQYSLDDTLCLTQDLIDLYPPFINIFIRRQPQEPQFSTVNTLRPYEVSNDTDLTHGAHALEVDHPSILLILSCHLRLIDIWEELFKHMHVCSGQKSVPFTPRQAACKAPPLNIGSYTPPPAVSIPMQMLMMLQLTSQLSDNAAELALEVRKPLEKGNCAGGSPEDQGMNEAALISLSTAEKVEGKASNMAQELKRLRSDILANGFLA